MSYQHISDRRRVELILIVHALRDIVRHGASRSADSDRCLALLDKALADILEPKPGIIDRAAKIYQKSIGQRYVEGAQIDTIGLAVFHWLELLTNAGTIVVGDGELGQALNLILPALEEAANRRGEMERTYEIARGFFGELQAEGYFRGVTMPVLINHEELPW